MNVDAMMYKIGKCLIYIPQTPRMEKCRASIEQNNRDTRYILEPMIMKL